MLLIRLTQEGSGPGRMNFGLFNGQYELYKRPVETTCRNSLAEMASAFLGVLARKRSYESVATQMLRELSREPNGA